MKTQVDLAVKYGDYENWGIIQLILYLFRVAHLESTIGDDWLGPMNSILKFHKNLS